MGGEIGGMIAVWGAENLGVGIGVGIEKGEGVRGAAGDGGEEMAARDGLVKVKRGRFALGPTAAAGGAGFIVVFKGIGILKLWLKDEGVIEGVKPGLVADEGFAGEAEGGGAGEVIGGDAEEKEIGADEALAVPEKAGLTNGGAEDAEASGGGELQRDRGGGGESSGIGAEKIGEGRDRKRQGRGGRVSRAQRQRACFGVCERGSGDTGCECGHAGRKRRELDLSMGGRGEFGKKCGGLHLRWVGRF